MSSIFDIIKNKRVSKGLLALGLSAYLTAQTIDCVNTYNMLIRVEEGTEIPVISANRIYCDSTGKILNYKKIMRTMYAHDKAEVIMEEANSAPYLYITRIGRYLGARELILERGGIVYFP